MVYEFYAPIQRDNEAGRQLQHNPQFLAFNKANHLHKNRYTLCCTASNSISCAQSRISLFSASFCGFIVKMNEIIIK